MYPCDCCPSVTPVCALTAQRFDAVVASPLAGWVLQVGAPGTSIDGNTTTSALMGYASSPANPVVTPVWDYSFTNPRNGVVGVRIWNNHGGVLNDNDGLSTGTQVTFLDAANVVLAGPVSLQAFNGGAPTDTIIPAINGVKTIRLSNLTKLLPAATLQVPGWRELQVLEVDTVFPCRRPNGTLEWYDVEGDLVPQPITLATCPEPAAPPPSVSTFTMNTVAWGDDGPGAGELLCNVIPAPSSTPGFTPTPPCFNPTGPGAPTVNWNGPISTVEWEYGSAAVAPGDGAVLFSFTSPDLGGTVTWPANGVPMVLGEQRLSNLSPNGFARIRATVIQAGLPASGNLRQDGGANLRLGPAVQQDITVPYRLRFELVAP